MSTDRPLAELFLRDESTDTQPDEVNGDARGFTVDTYLLMTIVDNLQAVQAAVIAAAGVDPPPVVPLTRPTTALEELREERRRRGLELLIAQFCPLTLN
ncbi:hypothetical protein ACFWPX_35495 [Nocardia sp. NPDC058518]|uniref:hypothetical protein n=1 Tax=Nocardia sp. NPDC058518 TaxID=3346534 RepID=UPI003668D8ED